MPSQQFQLSFRKCVGPLNSPNHDSKRNKNDNLKHKNKKSLFMAKKSIRKVTAGKHLQLTTQIKKFQPQGIKSFCSLIIAT